jgi:hypothetical protein
MRLDRSTTVFALLLGLSPLATAQARPPKQPKVAPGPNEPDWSVVLDTKYGLSMFGDLLNPVRTTPEATPGLFKKAGDGPVIYTPVIALGWRRSTGAAGTRPGPDGEPHLRELWSYKFKNTTDDVKTGKNLPPPLHPDAKTEFDPGLESFGLFVSNDGLADSRVYSEPARVKALNKRLASSRTSS